MTKTIRARFSHGFIEPLEKIDFPEGKEFNIIITNITTEKKTKESAFKKAAGRWKGTIDVKELIKNIYDDRLISTRPEVKL